MCSGNRASDRNDRLGMHDDFGADRRVRGNSRFVLVMSSPTPLTPARQPNKLIEKGSQPSPFARLIVMRSIAATAYKNDARQEVIKNQVLYPFGDPRTWVLFHNNSNNHPVLQGENYGAL